MSEERLVIALGGNALGDPDDRNSTVSGQATAARHAFRDLASILAKGSRILITHGNGPQVGSLLARSELSVDISQMAPLPLDTCVADTAGGLGYTLARELRNELGRIGMRRDVAAVLTEVMVAREDLRPTKPIGEEHPASQRPELEHRGWDVIETARGTVRRAVVSPEPLEVLQMNPITILFERGVVTIAGGGGGIPVVIEDGANYRGVEGVVDKDLVSALLAIRLRADVLMILTNVECAYVDYLGPNERAIGEIRARDLRALQTDGWFSEGSMSPKVEAVLRFVEATSGRGVICSLDAGPDGLAGETGTQVVP